MDLSKVSLRTLLLHNGYKFPGSCSSHGRTNWEHSGFAAKCTLWRSPVESICWPKSYSNADCYKVDAPNSAAVNVNGTAVWGTVTTGLKKWLLYSKTSGQKNMAYLAWVDKSKMYLSPLNMKLGLIKIFVKVMDKESEGFAYLKQKFPKISEAKIKEGIFVLFTN